MSRYHNAMLMLVRADAQPGGAGWPDRVGWPFVFERIVKRLHGRRPPSDDVFVLTEFRTDQLTPMAGLDEDSVAEYELVDPRSMPPIVLDGSLVIDGSHRLAAAKRRGDETIWAYVLNRGGTDAARRSAAQPGRTRGPLDGAADILVVTDIAHPVGPRIIEGYIRQASLYHRPHLMLASATGDLYMSDETGKPLVAYHGSATDFAAFEPGHRSGWSVPRRGFYFTDDSHAAGEFGSVVRAFNLRIRNPLDLRSEASLPEYMAVAAGVPQLEDALRAAGVETVYAAVSGGHAQSDDFVDAAAEAGYDAIIMPDALGGPTGLHFDSYIVFGPSQIVPIAPDGEPARTASLPAEAIGTMCSRCGSDLDVAGRAGADDASLCVACWERSQAPEDPLEPPKGKWWWWNAAICGRGRAARRAASGVEAEIEAISDEVRRRLVGDHELEDDPPKALCLDFARGLVDEFVRRGYSAGVTQGTFKVDWPDEETYGDWDEDDFEADDGEDAIEMSAEEVMG